MPAEGVPLSPPSHILTASEIYYLSSLFVRQGVTKIRLTGGEPTVRPDLVSMMRSIGSLRGEGLKELCITTNGLALHRKLENMVDAGLTGINLSLDTLDPFQFQLMTRRDGFEAVMRSLDRVLALKSSGVPITLKINVVVMRGLNDREIIPFVELARERDLEVRFIEYMPFDGNKWQRGKMFGYQEMLELISEKFPNLERVQDHPNNTSKTYRVPGFAGRMGFITSMTHNFCGTCNRLRVTSDGNLKVCLFGNAEVSLRDVMRKGTRGRPLHQDDLQALKATETAQPSLSHDGIHSDPSTEEELLGLIGLAVQRKKAKHAGMDALVGMKNRPMILIGGSDRLDVITKIRLAGTAPSQTRK
ncbi:MAG: hypothetical protein M1815_002434 [Lichina confinis]|nr:MAG: hypothetical protein M1815_002434 [Lichina confinis]